MNEKNPPILIYIFMYSICRVTIWIRLQEIIYKVRFQNCHRDKKNQQMPYIYRCTGPMDTVRHHFHLAIFAKEQ